MHVFIRFTFFKEEKGSLRVMENYTSRAFLEAF